MLIAAAGLLLPVGLTVWANVRDRACRRSAARRTEDQPLARTGGFRLIFTQRYLLLIACLIVMVNVVNTLGEFLMGRLMPRMPSLLSPREPPAASAYAT
jgi:AAA family ATP:ADP antiporter